MVLSGIFPAFPALAGNDTAEADRKIAIQVLCDRGRDFARLQDWENSAEAYTEALRRDPVNPDILFGLGYALYRREDFRGAGQAFRKALRSDPDHASSTLWLGMTLLDDRDPDGARRAFEKLMETEEVDPRAYYGLASVHDEFFRKRGANQDRENAELYFKQYLSVAKRSSGTGTEYLDRARARILELKYGEEGRLYNRALESYRQGDYEESLRLLDLVLKRSPLFQKAHFLKGRHHNTRGSPLFDPEFRHCIEELEKAPDEPGARCMLGSIYRLMGKEGLARANLLAAVRLDPDCQSALNMLGALYHQAGEGEKTMDAYQRSLAVNPSTPEGQAARLELGVLQGISKGPLVLHGNPEEKQRELEAQGIVHDTYLTARHNGILERIVRRNHFPYLWEKYSLFIINNPSLQAYSMPGGRIYLNVGLLQHVKEHLQDSEDVLAFIVAHEIAHVERDHVIDTVRHVQALGRTVVEGLPRTRTILTEFQRSDEFEADRLGMKYAYVAGFDPYAGVRFLKRMIRRGDSLDDEGSAILEERLQGLQQTLGDLRGYCRSFEEGLTRLAGDDYKGAQVAFEQFLTAFPGDPSARNNLAVALHKQALCCKEPAQWWKASDIEPLRLRAIRRKQRSTTGPCNEPWCARMASEAERQLKIVLAANPRNDVALNNLANLYDDTGRSGEARALHREALSLNPEYAEARNNYGALLCAAGEYRSGIEQLESAILSQPARLPAYYNLGKAYFELGNYAAAVRVWEKYLNQDTSRSGWAQRAERHSGEALARLGKKEPPEHE